MRGFPLSKPEKTDVPCPLFSPAAYQPLVCMPDVRDRTKDGLPTPMDPGLMKAVVRHAFPEPISLQSP
jgi:hypothetical protein